MNHTAATLIFFATSLALPHAAPAQVRYFPLEPGTLWSYSASDPVGLRTEILVLERRGIEVRVRFQYRLPGIPGFDPRTLSDATLVDRVSEIDIRLPGGDYAPYYRFEEESSEHRDPIDACIDRTTAVISVRNAAFTVPAGTFSACLDLYYNGQRCADYRRGGDVWCPDVGLVWWAQWNMAAPQEWSLESIDHLPAFERGDTNQDRRVDISDAIATLNHLFIAAAALPCADAADSNDDGAVDLSDAVATLTFLFSDVSPLPAPSAGACGIDLTDDDLDCESGGVCAP